jgi:hypothetical protein
MAMLQMLSEVICTEELLALIALSKFVYRCQVLATYDPVGSRVVWELLAAVAADVVLGVRLARLGLLYLSIRSARIWGDGGAGVKGGVVVAVECRARPRLASKVKRILVAFRLVLVLESIVTILTVVLFLGLMLPKVDRDVSEVVLDEADARGL